MASAWRIVRARRAGTAFSGEGAWHNGGRWSSTGVRVVYVSEHQSTAALEILVHTSPVLLPETYQAFRLEWPDGLTEKLSQDKWPSNWRISPPPLETMEIGDRWVTERRSAGLAVPSACFLWLGARRGERLYNVRPNPMRETSRPVFSVND